MEKCILFKCLIFFKDIISLHPIRNSSKKYLSSSKKGTKIHKTSTLKNLYIVSEQFSLSLWFGTSDLTSLCITSLSFGRSSFTSDAQSCRLFATPWTTACQASLSITNSWSPPKPMSIESHVQVKYLYGFCYF